MDLSVIIVNYNVRPFLENSLVSIGKAMQGITGEVIVVDNASDDGSVDMMRQKFPSVRIIANERNTGFGSANNQAMRIAGGRFFLLLNPDTVVQEDTFHRMIDFFNNHPDAGLAGCRVLNPDGTLQLPCRRSFPTPWVAFTKISGLSSLFPSSPLFGKYNLTYRDPDRSYPVDAVSGSFMFLRREAYEQTKGFDEQFFMYGEDLDLCYRIQQGGWKIYYTPDTQIIHYKGQSARRSDIDEVRLFYEAMRVFVRKHFPGGVVSTAILRAGIGMREWMAFVAKISKPLGATSLDVLFINISLLLGEAIWLGDVFRFPSYAYPAIIFVPWALVAGTMYTFGVYTTRKLSIVRAAGSVIIGYVILSALVFFFKQYGFSRGVVAVSGLISLVLVPGWRLAARIFLRSPEHRPKSLFGRRTIIVGTGETGLRVLRKLRMRVQDGYNVVGFIDTTHKHVGERIAGVEILGSIDNIGKVVYEQKVSEVIVSTDALTYTDILAMIARTRNRAVNFRLVPSSLEVIIGKTHIDELNDIPLVEIDYNLHKPVNRFVKRTMDVLIGGLLLVSVTPWRSKRTMFADVVKGKKSLVGPSPEHAASGNGTGPGYWGKAGLTGLVQVNSREDMSPEEVEQYQVYYAKNQSFWLDIEILVKSVLRSMKR